MPNPIIFLDVDGCLNDHSFDKVAESCTILRSCVIQLNRIIFEVNPKIVLSSAWRYMILMKAMSISGFEYMLRTHGVACTDRIIGTTNIDIKDGSERAMQVYQWIQQNKSKIGNYVIIDDMDFGYKKYNLNNFVQTDGKVGLTEKDADEAILYLTGRK